MRTPIAPLLALLTVGCMAPAKPPSLMPRAIETAAEAESVATPTPVAAPVPAAIAEKLAALIAETQAGDAEFTRTEQANAKVLGAGRSASSGSEAWIAAQVVRSALEVARQRSAGALAEIDSFAIAQGVASTPEASAGVQAIEIAQREIEAIVLKQSARLEMLSR